MSARDAMAAMLDELMGPKRNVELGKDTKVSFDDPNICPYYLVGFCPHDMFTNTKADLGSCLLVHDDNLRRMYPEAPEYGKLGFEKRLLRFLVQLDEDNMRRIRKNKDKLSGMDDNGRRKLEDEKRQIQKDIDDFEEELQMLIKAAEEAGNEGNISKCQELVTKSENLGVEKKNLEDKLVRLSDPAPQAPSHLEEMAIKPMEVCEVCGSMLIVNDAQQRVEEHLTGKMHTGFQKIRTMIQTLKEKIKEFDEAEEARREERRKEKASSGDREDRDRDRDRRRRSSRSRSPYRSSRDSRSKNYDRYDRDRRRDHRERRY
uniref:Luc7-like protein 3 n=1 Tax=Caenorhabditis japonica TaxID=281687 RepID=A0A8R1DGM8_CAEJA